MKKILFAVVFIGALSCKTEPNINGKWSIAGEGNIKYVSEFRSDGTVITNHYEGETDTTLNLEPLLLNYSLIDKGGKWHIDFRYPDGQHKVSTPLEIISEDTIATFYKKSVYQNTDSIVSWGKVIHVRVD